jgi:hypothetical protein
MNCLFMILCLPLPPCKSTSHCLPHHPLIDGTETEGLAGKFALLGEIDQTMGDDEIRFVC